jgi:hypothetical protein
MGKLLDPTRLHGRIAIRASDTSRRVAMIRCTGPWPPTAQKELGIVRQRLGVRTLRGFHAPSCDCGAARGQGHVEDPCALVDSQDAERAGERTSRSRTLRRTTVCAYARRYAFPSTRQAVTTADFPGGTCVSVDGRLAGIRAEWQRVRTGRARSWAAQR